MTDVTILVADDHASLRVLMRTLLSRSSAGWIVIEAADGNEALAAYHEHPVNLAILDQRMPGLTGTEVARALREDDFDGPIVLFSAYLDPEIERAADQLDVLTLPKSDIDQLVDVARRALPAD